MSMSEQRGARRCAICGARLISDYYYTGRCAVHQTTKEADAKIGKDAVVAKRAGLSYGQYMAVKKEGST
jgi:hypothetical protein